MIIAVITCHPWFHSRKVRWKGKMDMKMHLFLKLKMVIFQLVY